MYQLIKRDGLAKRGRLKTVHGVIETPVFMNVGTAAAIKGAVSTDDLQQIKTQVELSNTYHLHVRPGDEVVKKLGGLHKFMTWDKPILTDSGGFQVFSLAGLRRIKEEGVYFNSHIDGHKIFMGPEESMQIQSNLASTIAMAFDECPSSIAKRDYMEKSVDRTTRWLKRCKAEMNRLNSLPDTINKQQMLFGINQGGVYEDIRIRHAVPRGTQCRGCVLLRDGRPPRLRKDLFGAVYADDGCVQRCHPRLGRMDRGRDVPPAVDLGHGFHAEGLGRCRCQVVPSVYLHDRMGP